MTPILEARNLAFAYGSRAPVIHDLSFTVNSGTLGAVIGSNGCGKSTLVKLLAGILKPTRGDIMLDGVSLIHVPRMVAARRIAYVPQAFSMVFPFTALEVVITGRSPFRKPFRFEDEHDRECALKALEVAGAAHLADRLVTTLSGGEQQLVMVARALAQEPACILLDEPSSSLDLKHRSALMRTLVRLRDTLGMAVLVVTHDLHLMDKTFDRVIALRHGGLMMDAAPVEVLTQAVLAEVYEDQGIRTLNVEGRIVMWCD
jgi:iron complex transport system ATP-binding protein